MSYADCAYFEILYDIVRDCFPAISAADSRVLLRETILAPTDYQVEFNGQIYPQAQIIGLLGHRLGQKCLEQSPETTYENILQDAAKVIKHMNDGYVSVENYHERQTFLNRINAFEFTLFATLAFLKINEGSEQQTYRELILNLRRLRELNDLVKKYTRDASEITIDRAEFERARPIYKLLKSLRSLGYEYMLSQKETIELEINHENDEDLSDDYPYKDWLKRLMLLQLRKEEQTQNQTPAAENICPAEPLTEQLLIQLRGKIQKRKFDISRFLMLEEKNEAAVPNGQTN